MSRDPKSRLGEKLVQDGVITEAQLLQALEQQNKTGDMLGIILLQLGFIPDESLILPALAEQFEIEWISLKDTPVAADVLRKVPAKMATHYRVMPFRMEDQSLHLAMANPFDIQTIDDIEMITKTRLHPVLAGPQDIAQAIQKYYGVGAETIEDLMDSMETSQSNVTSVEDLAEMGSEASISKFLNQILLEGHNNRATDIHIEPFEDQLRIRYRIDGVLYDAKVAGDIKYFKDAINSRIKIMSNLNIAEKRLPQDGRFKVRVGDEDLDLRISFLPTPYGESAVIRILNSLKLYSMEELGLSRDEMDKLDRMISRPYGIIFVTGPTGSGKTTTLYSCLAKVNQEDRKIITIEDPIEYQLSGITQIQIHPQIGLTFAAGLRSMLRHDPDIMMVGEVRDFETAQITIQVALTGHMVLSTLHTNDAASGVTRLMDMGIEPYLVTSAVNCFVAQRLVRVICRDCKQEAQWTPELLKDFEMTPESAGRVKIYEGKGCRSCRFTGYKGREAIYEFLTMNDEIREMILNRASAGHIKEKAVTQGMRTLRQHGWTKVAAGITSPSEVLRVTHQDIMDD